MQDDQDLISYAREEECLRVINKINKRRHSDTKIRTGMELFYTNKLIKVHFNRDSRFFNLPFGELAIWSTCHLVNLPCC